MRKFLYQRHVLCSYKAPVPVVVVGNIVVGGAGKTPLVIGLAELLQSENDRVGIVSRGFGRDIRDGQDVREVASDSDVMLVGDEPLMIKQRLHCPVFVGKHRASAVKALLDAYPDTTIVLCDDGLQHYRLQRDIEIVVMASSEAVNDCLLPAGPLREPLSRLEKTDIKVTRDDKETGYQIVPLRWRNLATGECRETTHFAADAYTELVAMTGIARPDHFANTLKKLDIDATLCAYPDHFIYTGDEVNPSVTTLTTAKDAVKLSAVGVFPNVWVLDVQVKLSDCLRQTFLAKVREFSDY